MKYLRQENNRFIFEDGGEELYSKIIGAGAGINYKKIVIWADFDVDLCGRVEPYKDIQTAVQMMTILKEEGLV